MRHHALPYFSGIVLLLALMAAPTVSAQVAFVPNTSDDTVSIIDVLSGTVIGAVLLGSGVEPQGVAVASNGTTAYVTNLFGPSVSIIDAARFPQAVIGTITTPQFPPGVALSPNGTQLYVTNGLTTTPEVSVISTVSNTITASIPLPGTPAGVAVTPDGAHVYAANGTSTGAVSVITTAGNTVSTSIPVNASPDGIAITPSGAKAYVTHFLSLGTVSVINTATNTVTKSIPVGSGPIGVAISPDGTQAFVANNMDNSVSVIATATDTVTATIPVGQGPFGVSFTTDGTKAFVANKTDDTVSEIDVASGTVVNTITVGGAPAAFGNFVGKAQPASALEAAVLPGGRTVQVGATATVFTTILNPGTSALNNCRILLPTSAPAGMSMAYQTTDPATNNLTGTANAPVTIAANGSQTFVLSFQSTAATTDSLQPLLFVCNGTNYAPIFLGVNTIDLQFSTTPVPDVIAVAATATGNGILNVPLSGGQEGAFAVASDNVGASAPITVTADTGSANLPLSITLCQTNPSTAQCLAAPAPTVTLAFATAATPTFSIFVGATGAVPFSPAVSRVFLRFLDSNGVSHGSTSVAVQTN